MIEATQQSTLRGLELAVLRRLDGILQGDYRGLLPGHGFDPGEARIYNLGDDVRRIDWNVTARTAEPHVRDTIADRELETTLVVDLSASMSFGTAHMEKRDTAVAAAAAIGFLVSRGGNRIGGLVAAGPDMEWVPHRSGRRHLYAILGKLSEVGRDTGAGDLTDILRSAERLAGRRGLVVVVSDFLDPGPWDKALRAVAHRHDAVAIEIIDPREQALPDVGTMTMVDPETGRRRFVDTSSPRFRADYAAAAETQRDEIRRRIRGTSADHIRLQTDRDWLADLVHHVVRRRVGHTTGKRP